jgi:hypothetical protein
MAPCKAVTTTSTQNLIGSIGKQNSASASAAKAKEAASRLLTIKKCGLKSESDIVIEILQSPQSVTGSPPPGSLMLWVQQLSSTPIKDTNGTTKGDITFTFPNWPPRKVQFNAGITPNFSHLKRSLSSNLSVSYEKIKVFKYMPHASKWIELKHGMKSTTKKGKKSNVENILMSPYAFKNGDFVVVAEMSHDTSTTTTATASNSNESIIVDRVEDYYERWLWELDDKTKDTNEGSSSSKKGSSKNKKGKSVVEISLKFGGDLDFSDDNASEDDES